MARAYDMRKRQRAAQETTDRIVEAAHELLARPDGGRLTLNEVAEAAGVTRVTIYNRIGSRAELLRAVFQDQGRLIGFDRVLAAMAHEDPTEAVVRTIRESCRAWAVMPIAIRRTLALAVIDEEVRTLVEAYERERRKRLAGLVRRLKAAGLVRGRGASAQANAVLALVTSFPAFDHLTLDASPDAAASRLVRIASSSLGLPR